VRPPLGRVAVIRGDARALPLPDESVDLICTSPPFLNLRSYQDGGRHYEGQIGTGTQDQFLEDLWHVTAECARVLKPTGSMFVELGDSYTDKSLNLSPHRYAIGCIDRLGLLLRAEIVWDRPNGLPESVTDRIRRSHSVWFHLVRQPRYYSAVDEVREEYAQPDDPRAGTRNGGKLGKVPGRKADGGFINGIRGPQSPLGKLPGSVSTIATEPLTVPAELGVDHFACVDSETEILTRRGWLRHDQLAAGDEVAGYDISQRRGTWTTCESVHHYGYDGPMVAVEKRDLSMLLTPNHRTVAWTRDRGGSPTVGPVVIEANDLAPRHYIPRSAEWDDEAVFVLGEDLAALLGWIAAEGWYTAGGGIGISQSFIANPANVEKIRKLLGRLDGIEREDVRTREWRGRPAGDVTWYLKPRLAGIVRELMPDKRITEWLANLPRNEARALLDAFVDGDGHIRPDGRISIFQNERENLDWLQLISVTLGYRTRISEDRANGRFVLYLTRDVRPITLRKSAGKNEPIPTEHYRGTVWCPSTGTGTFFARRRGIVFVTGNSFPSAWPYRLVKGWSPPGICTACGEGRRPSTEGGGYDPGMLARRGTASQGYSHKTANGKPSPLLSVNLSGPEKDRYRIPHQITGYVCACTPYTDHPGTGERHRNGDHPAGGNAGRNVNAGTRLGDLGSAVRVGPWREYHFDRWTPAPTRPSLVVDPFGGTGTTAMAAVALGRDAISVDLSADYGRLARWRIHKSGGVQKLRQERPPVKQVTGQADLFGEAL
jgi:DNA modification methylase